VWPSNLHRSIRFHVEGVELRRSSDEHQQDAIHVRIAGCPEGSQAEPVGQAQSERSERSGMQKVAPPRAIAELSRAVRIQSKHAPSWYGILSLAHRPHMAGIARGSAGFLFRWALTGTSARSNRHHTRQVFAGAMACPVLQENAFRNSGMFC